MREEDLNAFLTRLPFLKDRGAGLREFFKVEHDLRSGRINSWIFRGFDAYHQPEIIILTVLKNPGREPAP